jgi:ABC-type branched-subunit amino acid transport system ATPase component
VTLAVERLSISFGRTAALREVSFTVHPGQRLGLVGPNGAGKTTLLDGISGLVRPDEGEVWLGATRLTGLAPDRVAGAGVARTFQTPRILGRLTVEANARAGRAVDAGPWLARVGLEARRGDLAAGLTPGEARRLELARALAGEPRVLLLDEPFGGLTAGETDALARVLEQAAAPGRVVILVEHKLAVIRRLADRVVVLQHGEAIFDGPPAAMGASLRVLDAYLGRVGGHVGAG